MKMTDAGNRKLTLLTALVVALLAAVVAQSVMMFGLRRQWRGPAASEEKEPSRLALAPDDETDSNAALALPPSPLANDPFDWNHDDWDPFKEMQAMHDRINQMFGSAYNRFQHSDDFGSLFGEHSFSPAIDMEDKGDRYVITVDLPGAEDARLDIKLNGQTLAISGTVQSESKEEDQGRMLRRERRSGKFHRAITLPGPVQADKMTTQHKKGVLHIEIPKAKTNE
jgi:HSP20 family protein